MDDITFAWTITITGILVVFVALVAVAVFVIVFQRIDQPKARRGRWRLARSDGGDCGDGGADT
jgi:hypothetical protein